jgi:hypothetical protein
MKEKGDMVSALENLPKKFIYCLIESNL